MSRTAKRFPPFQEWPVGAAFALALFATSTTPSLAQAVCSLGEEKWLLGCHVELTSKRYGGSRHCTASPSTQFILVKGQIGGASKSNGSVTLSTIPAAQHFKWQEAIQAAHEDLLAAIAAGEYRDFAGNEANARLKTRIQEDRKRATREALKFASTHQTVLLEVTTDDRDRSDTRSSWAKGQAWMKVRCVAPGNMVEQLAAKYGLTPVRISAALTR